MVIARLIAVLGICSLVGCSSSKNPVVDHRAEAATHAHAHRTAKNAGDYHVMNFMNRRSGAIGVQVLDRWEEPCYIEASTIKAKIERTNGASETVMLKGEGWGPPVTGTEEYGNQEGATIFSMRAPWVKEAHDAKLTVWVPLPDGKTHVLSFECEARNPAPTHSGLRK